MSIRYSINDVSIRETGRRALDIEDYTLASMVDTRHRSVSWLAFGDYVEHIEATDREMADRTDRAAKPPKIATPKLGLGKAADEKPGKGRRRA
jgi:hypothetical protein